jgi:branched-chain amino acid transport system ATP-binding protein
VTTAALEAQNLQVWHGPRLVLDDVSLTIERGGILFVVGDNGAGRSTLVAALGGLIPRRGEVVVSGQTLPSCRPAAAVRAGLVVVPERRQLFPGLTVADNLLLGLYTSGARTVRTARRSAALNELYQRFPVLDERRSQLAGTLSGGEQQILALGRALVTRPAVLLIDEPFLGVAPAVADTIIETLTDFRSNAGALLVVDDRPPRMAEANDQLLILG